MDYTNLGTSGLKASRVTLGCASRGTSAIIGPRTMEQLESQLPAADVVLDDAVLDRIDGIVKPGVNLNPADTSYGDHALRPTARRR
jgi:aryl-alcohol dehydrogenase-like predicted oxidoreductase